MTRKPGHRVHTQPIIIPFVPLKNRKKQVYTFWVEREIGRKFRDSGAGVLRKASEIAFPDDRRGEATIH